MITLRAVPQRMLIRRMRLLLLAILILILIAPRPGSAEPSAAHWRAGDLEALRNVALAAGAEGVSADAIDLDRFENSLRTGDAQSIDAAAAALFSQIASAFHDGTTPPSARPLWRLDRPQTTEEDIRALMDAALAAHEVAAALQSLLPSHGQYLALRSALASAPPEDADAVMRLKANLERWRWLPRDFGREYVLVNIPAGELVHIRDGVARDRRRIIFGARRTPTYQFSAQVTGVAFNPIWHVPASIVKSEGIDALVRDRPSTASKLGYALGPDGVIRQAPGPSNPLGRMKLIMPNRFAIFVHDTPGKHLFDRETRAFSHGCLRVEGALGLAASLLAPDWSESAIEQAIAEGTTFSVPLAEPIPIYIAYLTAVADETGKVTFLKDVYDLDKSFMRALERKLHPAEAPSAQVVECAG